MEHASNVYYFTEIVLDNDRICIEWIVVRWMHVVYKP